MKAKKLATVFAVLAAALYAINIPLSKLLLTQVGSTMMAAFLYLGTAVLFCTFYYDTQYCSNDQGYTGTGASINTK